MKTVFVIETRPTGVCTHCDVYKATQHDKLLELLRTHSGITVYHFEAVNQPDGTRQLNLLNSDSGYYHPELLTTYWRWFPSFMLFSAKEWEEKGRPLNGQIYGGLLKEVDEGSAPIRTIEEVKNEFDARAEKIYTWLISKLSMIQADHSRVLKTYENHKTDIRKMMIKRQL